jgi:hypothetical protein
LGERDDIVVGDNKPLREQEKFVREGFAQPFLDAAYEGTIRVARMFGKRKVFLTLVGGGVFRNDLDWLALSIEKIALFAKQQNMQIYLVCRTNGSSKQRAFLRRMKKIEYGRSQY